MQDPGTKPDCLRCKSNLVLTVALLLTCECLFAQVDSRYNIYHAKIGLMNGVVIKGVIMSFTPDSLGLRDKMIAPPGARAQLRYGTGLVRGTVAGVTATNILLTDVTGASLSIPRDKVTYLHITANPNSEEATHQFQQRWYKGTAIKYLALHKKGAGGKGALIGMACGVTLGYLAGTVNEKEPQPGQINIVVVDEAAATAVMFGIVGTALGAGLGTINNKFMIEGDLTRFRELRQRVVKNSEHDAAGF